MYPRYSELEEEEEYILHRQPEATTGNARAEVHWDEASSTDGEESEEELEMTEDEDNVELSGNLGLHCAMTGNIVLLIDEY